MTERAQSGTADQAKPTGRSPRRQEKSSYAQPLPPASALEALERAREHGRTAVAEALYALHALMDAASLATTGAPADAHRGLGSLTRTLEEVASAFGGGDGAPLLGAVADALEAEIARWEERATQDPDARAVLRAYLGVRELLWELGVRRPASAEGERREPNRAPGARGAARADTSRRRTAIQRVPLEG